MFQGLLGGSCTGNNVSDFGSSFLSSDASQGALRFVAMRRPMHTADAAKSAVGQNPPSNEELLLHLTTGDDNALGLLFERYSRMVLAIGYRVLRDRTEAEELVQDAFLYIRQKAALFDPAKGTAKAWLIQVAYHRSLDRRAVLKKQYFWSGTNVDEIHDASRSASDIEQELGAKYSAAQLKKAFGQLSERQRMTLELFFYEGMSLREVAQRLDDSLENVRHHYYRALGKLRKSSALVLVRKERSHES